MAWSITLTSSAPSGSDCVSGSGAVTPSRRAVAMILRAALLGGSPSPMRDRQSHGHRVQRMGQRVPHRHRAAIGAAVILRAPVAEADRRVDHGRLRREFSAHQRGQIDIGLERRARLALRVDGAVELAGAVVAPADQRAHGAESVRGSTVARLLGVDRPARSRAALSSMVVFGLFLQGGIERRAHGEHAVRSELAGVGQRLDLVEGPVEIPVGRRVSASRIDRRGRIALGVGDLVFASCSRRRPDC